MTTTALMVAPLLLVIQTPFKSLPQTPHHPCIFKISYVTSEFSSGMF